MALFSLLLLNGVVAAGTADDAGSLISQAVAGAVHGHQAVANASMRTFPRDRGACAAAAT